MSKILATLFGGMMALGTLMFICGLLFNQEVMGVFGFFGILVAFIVGIIMMILHKGK